MNSIDKDKYLYELDCACTKLFKHPFKIHGRYPDAIDCFGLILYVCQKSNIPLVDYNYEGETKGNIVFLENFSNYVFEVSLNEIEKGDILEFDSFQCEHKLHLGIALNHGKFIHAQEGSGVIYGRYSIIPFKNTLKRAYRFK